MKHVKLMSKETPKKAALPELLCDAKAILAQALALNGIECPCFESKCGTDNLD